MPKWTPEFLALLGAHLLTERVTRYAGEGSIFAGLRSARDIVIRLLSDVDAEADRIAGDRTLSALGKGQATRRTIVPMLERINSGDLVKNLLARVQTRRAELQSAINANLAPPPEPYGSEIRAFVAAKEGADRMTFLTQQVQAGNALVAAAVLGGPASSLPFLSGLDAETAARFRGIATRALRPKEVEELETLDYAWDKVAMPMFVRAVEMMVERASLVPAPGGGWLHTSESAAPKAPVNRPILQPTRKGGTPPKTDGTDPAETPPPSATRSPTVG